MKLTCLPPRLRTAGTERLTGLVAAPQPRTSSASRGYGHKWRVARATWLRAHPLCVFCERAGYVTAATVVDHIVPHCGNMALFWLRTNWQGLCDTCHASVKAKLEHDAGYRG